MAETLAQVIKQELDNGANAVRRGDIALGEAKLRWVLERDPENVLGWLWMSRCANARHEKIKCFNRVLSIQPTNHHALAGLKMLNAPFPGVDAEPVVPVHIPVSSSALAAVETPAAAPLQTQSRPRPRSAGQTTRRMAHRRWVRGTLIAVGGLAAIGMLGFLLQNAAGLGVGSGGILVLLVLLWLLPDLLKREIRHQDRRERHAIRGAEGEERVAHILESLGEEFLVMHDVESPYGNIDHIVIGERKGVFLLETKAHGGRVELSEGGLMVNGKPPEKDFITQTLQNTYWLRDEIAGVVGQKPWITALLVFANAFVPRLPAVKGVRILNKKFLLATIESGGRRVPLNARIWEMRDQIEALLLS
jgi:Holliday junction resolvase-like predicted endonuclease